MTSTNVDPASPTINNYADGSKKSAASAFAAALSLGTFSFASNNIKPVKLTLTPHHLFYLLSQFEELEIPTGPMNVRLESLHAEASPANYVSFLSQSQRSKGRSDRDSLHSVSSVRSALSSMSTLWSSIGIGAGSTSSKSEKAKAQMVVDTKYLYSAFTKIPCLRLSPDRRARMISGYEEFPFDTAVPLIVFKNLGALEICDVDFRQFYGWDRLADQLRSLTLKRANLDNPLDLLVGIVLDDMDKRRRRSSKTHSAPMLTWPSSPYLRYNDLARTHSAPGSPVVEDKTGHSVSPRKSVPVNAALEGVDSQFDHSKRSKTNHRPHSSRLDNAMRHAKTGHGKFRRSGSGSSNSSDASATENHRRSGSSSNMMSMGILPASKWRFLKHLSLSDNALTSMGAGSLAPLANSLHSLDLSSNLFTEMPDCLAELIALRSLNMANCMIENLHFLARNPLPAITALNLRANRLMSIAGVERLLPLERLDLRENRLHDPMEIARLTGIPEMREIWILHNPLVKSHKDYRITVFNLFRSTAGYLEDIVIDSSGPSYSERRQLRERVAEPEPVPVVKSLPLEQTISSIPSQLHPSNTLVNEVNKDDRPSLQTTQSEFAVSSSRRRKGPRRRIVDLAGDHDTPIIHQEFKPAEAYPIRSSQGTGSLDPKIETSDSLADQQNIDSNRPDLTTTQTGAPSPDLSEVSHPVAEPGDPFSTAAASSAKSKDRDFDGETYRRKVEALKSEVGSDWLSVLNEQGWFNDEHVDHPPHHFSHFASPGSEAERFRAPATEILSSGRTLS